VWRRFVAECAGDRVRDLCELGDDQRAVADNSLIDALALTVLSELLKFTFTLQVVLLLFYDSASVSSSTI